MALAATTLGAVGLGYGFLAQRNQLFPAAQLERLVQGAKHLLGRGLESKPSDLGREMFTKDGGMWSRRDTEADGWNDELRRLQALGYVDGSRPAAVGDTGVTVLDPEKAAMGLNLYSSAHAPEAILMDMRGQTLHRWAFDRDAVWPDLADIDPGKARKYFRRLHLFENGDLLAIYEYTGLIRLDAYSRLLWAHQAWDHHDLDVGSDGRIYVLVRNPRRLPRWDVEVWDEEIAILSPAGESLGSVSISRAIERSRYAPLLDGVDPVEGPEPFDVFHTNTVQLLDGSLAHLSPAFSRGNLLVSFRKLNTIGIIDPVQERMVWALSASWRGQHEPTLLPRGSILLFNNLAALDRSSVVEFDPFTQRVRWEYSGTRKRPLFSALFGSTHRLPNGNTLITESEHGRVLEVTPDKEIVWEFISPHTAGDEDQFVGVIPELIRLPADFPVANFVGTTSAAELGRR